MDVSGIFINDPNNQAGKEIKDNFDEKALAQEKKMMKNKKRAERTRRKRELSNNKNKLLS